MKKTLLSLPCWGRWHGRAVTDEVSSSNEKAKTDLIHQKRSRRGFTIVELVVTLTIIVLVSAISIGVVAVNNKTYGETIDMIEATNIAENAVECFRFAVNNGGGVAAFENAFNRTGASLQKQDEPKDGYTDSYKVNVDDVVVEIDIDTATNTITVSASSETDANLLEPITYTVR